MRSVVRVLWLGALSGFWAIPATTVWCAQDRPAGEVQVSTSSKINKSAGVWVDGGYAGRLGDLGRLKVAPGEHEVLVRQAGYTDFTKSVAVEPKAVVGIEVAMERDTRFTYPDPNTCSELRLDVRPANAAVFVDDFYIGTADQFYGLANAMQLIPGRHRIKIAMPGFKSFETEVVLSSRQKSKIRTALAAGSVTDADLVVPSDARKAASAATNENPAAVR